MRDRYFQTKRVDGGLNVGVYILIWSRGKRRGSRGGHGDGKASIVIKKK